MEMAGRQSAFIVQAQASFEFRLAALADAQQRMIFDDSKSFAPNFKPVSSAPLIRVEHRDAPRAFNRTTGGRQHVGNSGDETTRTRRRLLANAITNTAMPSPASAARVEVRINVIASSGIARVKKKAALDRLFGVAIRRPTASAAMS